MVTSTSRYCTRLHRHGMALAAAETAAHCTNTPVYLLAELQLPVFVLCQLLTVLFSGIRIHYLAYYPVRIHRVTVT